MKIEDLPRPSLLAIGAAGLAATALLGAAAAIALTRNPEATRAAVRRVARETAKGVGMAALLAAQTRERLGDLWAEAREEAIAELDAKDFAKAAAGAAAANEHPAQPGAAHDATAPGTAHPAPDAELKAQD